jgi:Phage integrase family
VAHLGLRIRPPLRFHDLRHMAGTLMSDAGVPPKRAQEILGHADVRTTLEQQIVNKADQISEQHGTKASNDSEAECQQGQLRQRQSAALLALRRPPGWNAASGKPWKSTEVIRR